ncbi:MAG: poly(A) polymerase [Microgenomates group bacterium LiPW_31]|nr:MAG: poly(A) polymerase [Microgenomates group bacterium LiPW_31]
MKFKIPPFVSKILNTFQKAGHEIYIVGGAVRDLLMKRVVTDWDFTTDATPEIVLGLFPDGFYDNKFGTVGISHPSLEKPYEITTFRKEIGYTDRRHPDKIIWGKTIQEDLVRRDFTINALALRPAKRGSGQALNFTLIDYHGGQKDIKKKLIRAVGNPIERFQEDALRMFRAVRIATQLGFTIEEKTFQAIKNNIDLIDHISAERIKDELLKLLSYSYAADGYMLLRNSGLAQKILPEVEQGFGVAQKSPGRHHLWDVGTHSVLSLKYCKSEDPIVKLATLLHDVGKPLVVKKQKDGTITFYNHEVLGASIASNIGRRFRLSKKDQERLVTLVRWHQFTVDERQTDSAIRRFIRNVGKENLQDILDLRVGDRLGGGARETSWRLEKFKKRLAEVQKQPFSVADLKVDGHDVMKTLNIHPGPLVGRILNQLFEEVVKNKTKNKRDYLLKRVKQIGKSLI